MNCVLDMERLRPDIYLTDEQKQSMRDALRMPSLAEWIKKSPNERICAFLKMRASDFRKDSNPSLRNIQPIDCDKLAELFDALAVKFSQNQKISDTKQSPSSEEIKPGDAIIDTICKALETVQNNLIGYEHRMVGNIIHNIKSEWGQRRTRYEGL